MKRLVLSKAVIALLPLMVLSGCKDKNAEPKSQIKGWKIASVDLVMPEKGKGLRAEFVGEHGKPTMIKWIDINDALNTTIPFYVAGKTTTGIQSNGTYRFFEPDEYRGSLEFTYDQSIVDAGGKFEYISCDLFSQHKDSWIKDSTGSPQPIVRGAQSKSLTYDQGINGFNYELSVSTLPYDMTLPSVGWPLISVNVSDNSKLMSVYDTKAQKNYLKYMLFGDMLLLNLRNYSNDAQFDFGSDPTYLPTVTVRSNGMAFRGSSFKLTADASGNRQVEPVNILTNYADANVGYFETKVTNLKFNALGDELLIPIWFRPYNPTFLNNSSDTATKSDGSNPFYITVELKYYVDDISGGKKEVVVSKSLNDLGRQHIKGTTGTLFDSHDGKFYRLNVDFGAKGISFGSNSFFNVTVTPPAFD